MNKITTLILAIVLAGASLAVGLNIGREIVNKELEDRYLQVHPLEGDQSYEDYDFIFKGIDTFYVSKDLNIYKVKELERGTCFYIYESNYYTSGDSVWVDCTHKCVDPSSNDTILCVILDDDE